MESIEKKANKIIKLFLDNDIKISQQLEILKLVKSKIEFCRNTGKNINQRKLDL